MFRGTSAYLWEYTILSIRLRESLGRFSSQIWQQHQRELPSWLPPVLDPILGNLLGAVAILGPQERISLTKVGSKGNEKVA